MIIPFLDLKKINAQYAEEINEAVKKVLNSGNYILGEEGKLFEKNFAGYCGTDYCIGVGNGTSALIIALKALNFPDRSEVILCSGSYIAAALAVSHCNLQPVLVDQDESSFNIDTNQIEEKINRRTVAILVTHLYGRVCEMDKVKTIAKKYNLKVIEDCAQAHGAVYNGRKAGALADIAAFSFYPTKNMGAMGDAGAITTSNALIADRIAKLRNYGFEKKDFSVIKGFNSRLDELQSAILNVKLKYLDSENLKRKDIAGKYLNEIDNPEITLPDFNESSVWHLFVVRTNKRKEFMKHMSENGIETKIHYPLPFYKQKAFKELNDCDMPVSDKIFKQVVSIPLNVAMNNTEVNHVIKSINKYK